MDWATASTSSSERSARNVTSNPCSSWSAGSCCPPLAAASTAIVFTALSWLGGIFRCRGSPWLSSGRARVKDHPAERHAPVTHRRGSGTTSRSRSTPVELLICDGSVLRELRGCAKMRSLAGQRLDLAPVARGHGVLRGDPRAAYAGDVGQGEKVRGPG